MADNQDLVGLFLGLFMFILVFPTVNESCIDIRTHVNATDLEISVCSLLPTILIAFILVFAFLLVYLAFKRLQV